MSNLQILVHYEVADWTPNTDPHPSGARFVSAGLRTVWPPWWKFWSQPRSVWNVLYEFRDKPDLLPS